MVCDDDDVSSTQSLLSTLDCQVRRLRSQVLTELVNGSTGEYQVPKNILLIGQATAGKSSFVNLLKASLLGSYDQIAQPGTITTGSESQFTNRLVPYYNAGFTERELLRLKQEFPKISFPDDFQLPTITDMPGLENRPHFVLACILDGIVPADTQLVDPLASERRPAVSFSAGDLEVDHAVFVASVTQDVSVHLFQSAFAAVRDKGIPYFLLFTHLDCEQTGKFKPERAEMCRRESKRLLMMSDNSKLQSHSVINYNDDTPMSQADPTVYEVNLEIHRMALEAFLKIIKPRRRPRVNRMSGRVEMMQRYLAFRRDNLDSSNRAKPFTEKIRLFLLIFVMSIVQIILRPITYISRNFRINRPHCD